MAGVMCGCRFKRHRLACVLACTAVVTLGMGMGLGGIIAYVSF